MKKVLVFVPSLDMGGGQKMAVEIIKNIQQKNNENLQFRLLCLGPNKGNILDQVVAESGIDVVYLNKPEGLYLKYIPRIYRELKKFRPDVVHIHLPWMHYMLLPMILTRTKVRYYTVHNLAEKDASGLQYRIIKIALKYCHVTPVAISDLCKRSLCSVYQVPKDQVPCIYVGIDIDKFKYPSGIRVLSAVGFIAVARFSEQKNYFLMLRAFLQVHAQIPESTLTIIGNGVEQLEKFIIDNGLSNCVFLKGTVDKVEQYLWENQVYVMSSDYEGLPQTLLEAMAAGLPIVSTKAGGVVDVVKDGVNGFLVEIGDEDMLALAMVKAVSDKELYQKFSVNSAKMAEKYSIQTCGDQYELLYLR